MKDQAEQDIREQRDLLRIAEHALEQPAAHRDKWLEDTCGNNIGQLQKARALLRQADETHADSYAHLSEGLNRDNLELEIRNYRVLSKLGSGGMADVYLAERADGEFASRVAVKVVRTELLSDQLLQQFAVERQTLANLKHPNIVSLLDGGTTNNNLPYVVMELIDGVKLDEYIATTKLSRSARIELFDKICAAAEHAHASLVIHRDIKPGNIMIGADGEPKLYDFGLAKALEEGRREHTVAGAFTPAYASPEQVKGEPLSVATDIYSLGAVLYFILTQSPVHELNELSALASVNLICSGDIKKPSLIVHEKSLSTKVTPDLDAITLKALAPEPERRYVSVSALRSDLANLLARRPVMAQFDSRFYRIKKFISRYRTGLIASAVSLLALMGSLAISIAQTQRATEQLNRATIVSDLVGDILMSPASRWDVDLAAGPDAKMSDVLELAGQHVKDNLQDYPDIQVELLSRLSIALERLSKNEQSVRLSETAMALVENIESPELQIQALIAHGKNLTRRSNSEVGLDMLLKAEDMLKTAGSTRSSRYIFLLNDIGNAYGTLNKFDDQISTMTRAIALFTDVSGDLNHPALAGGYNNLASAQMNLGQFDAARTSIDKAKSIVDLKRNRDDVVRAYVYMYSAVLETAEGNLALAERENLLAIKELSRLLGQNTKEVSVAMARQAITYRLMNREQDAVSWLDQALVISERANYRSSEQMAAELMLANWNGNYKAKIAEVNTDRLLQSNYFYDLLSLFEMGIATIKLGDKQGGQTLVAEAMNKMESLYHGALLGYMNQRVAETSP